MKKTTLLVLLGLVCCNGADARAQQAGLKQLTDDRYQDGYSEWSPDGKYIVYTSAREEYHLWKVPAEGGTPVKVSEHNGHHARFSPDGSYIVYDGDKGTVVRIMSSSGGVPIRIVPDSIPIERSGNPVWSPDGSRIAFRSLHTVYVLDLPTGAFSKVYHKEGEVPMPVYWSKKENSILAALINTEDRTAHLWKLPVDAGEPTQLTFDERVTQASVSPGESYVVYSSEVSGNWDLWVIPFEGGRPFQLTSDPAHDLEPRWSPDGGRIVFTSTRGGAPDLWVMKVDLELIGKELERLNSK